MAKLIALKPKRILTPTNNASIERYLRTAKKVGCPADQIRNFARAKIVLQEHQLKASAAARMCDHPDGPNKVGFGGARGPGKSFWGIAQVVADDCQRYPGLKCLLLRKVGKSNKEAFDDLRRSVLHSVPHEYKRADAVLELPCGGRVILGHFKDDSDIDKYLGLEYDVILIEEATTLSEAKVKMIMTCLRTSKEGWRPRAYFTTNPGNVGHAWFKELFIVPYRKGTEKMTRFIPATVYQNKAMNRDYAGDLEASLVGWQRKAWLEGDWDIGAGQFFTTWNYDKHVIKPRPIEPHWQLFGSMDIGFAHWNMAYLLGLDGDGHSYIIAEHGAQRKLPNWHVKQLDELFQSLKVNKYRLEKFVVGGDAFQQRHAESTVADQYEAGGYDLERANMARIERASVMLSRLGDLEYGIEPTLSIFETCPKLIECIPELRHDDACPERVLKWDCDEEGKGGDDPYDAAGYGLMELAHDGGGSSF